MMRRQAVAYDFIAVPLLLVVVFHLAPCLWGIGLSCFRFDAGLIAHYSEAFDRGVALVQLGFPAERIRRILEKAAARNVA